MTKHTKVDEACIASSSLHSLCFCLPTVGGDCQGSFARPKDTHGHGNKHAGLHHVLLSMCKYVCQVCWYTQVIAKQSRYDFPFRVLAPSLVIAKQNKPIPLWLSCKAIPKVKCFVTCIRVSRGSCGLDICRERHIPVYGFFLYPYIYPYTGIKGYIQIGINPSAPPG